MRKNRPSRTAPKVGLAVLFVAGEASYAGLLPPGLAEATERLLLAADAIQPKHLRAIRQPRRRRIALAIENRAAPGHALYLALRKRFMQDEVEAAIAGGASQVLVVGAGMDTLCMRLAPDHPGVAFIEVDHPASQPPKRAALERLGALRPNLELLPVDLETTDLAAALAGHAGWRSDARTVVVAEGLLIFLAPETVDRLFAAVARATGPGSRFAFSYGVFDEKGRLKLGPVIRLLQGTILRAMGEGLRGGVREGGFAAFLDARSFRPVGPPERADLCARYLLPVGLDSPLGGFERVAVAEPAV